MAGNNRPGGRKKNVTGEGKGLYKKGEGLGTGPVGSQDGYAGKKGDKDKGLVEDLIGSALTGGAMGGSSSGSQGGPNLGSLLGGSAGGNQGGADLGDLLGGMLGGQQGGPSSGSQGSGSGLGNILGNLSDGQGQSGQQGGLGSLLGGGSQQGGQQGGLGSLLGGAQQGSGSQHTSHQGQTIANPFGQTASGSGGGGGTIPLTGGAGGGKRKGSCLRYVIMAVIIALVIYFLFSCLFGGDDSSDTSSSSSSLTSSSSQTQTAETQTSETAEEAAAETQDSQGQAAADVSSAQTYTNGSDILSQLFGSSAGSGSTYTSYGNTEGNSTALNTAVASGSRDKYTTILGNGQDKVTIMIYMCGTDLESQSAMATSDLMEMTKAKIADNVNIIVYTGGCKKWNNQVISNIVNQIYKVQSGGLSRLVDNAGKGVMTDPNTLASFIQFAAENFPANRNELIFWDHGSGSVAGYGYDEKNAREGSMDLAEIEYALKSSQIKFDFIGFDACLMATAENALMLDRYADYMVASEETEPGIGWYYTDWLTALSGDTSIPTAELGQKIVDSFVLACNQKCPGQKTTLSVVDLAEFSNTVPAALSAFSKSVSELVTGGNYKTVSDARYKTREFATSTRIDQVDLIDLCNKLGTQESAALAKALHDAVKYNRTSADMTNAYGVAVYFPYGRSQYLGAAVKTFNAIGISEEYTKCLQEVAGMSVSGQAGLGGQGSPYGSLFGDYGSSYSSSGDSADLISQLLGSFFGGDTSSLSGYSSSDLGYFTGRSMPLEDTAEYIAENHLDASQLVWKENEDGDKILSMTEENWQLVHDLDCNVFFDDGEGYIDLGLDNIYEFDEEGNLIADSGETWLAVNSQIVSYYHLDTVDDGENFKITGRIPALLNGERVDLIVAFDNEHENGYISGVQRVTEEGGLTLVGKVQAASADMEEGEEGGLSVDGEGEDVAIRTDVPALQDGDELQFLCDYYDYDGNYQDSYHLGEAMTVDGDLIVSDVTLPEGDVVVTYRLTDIYDREYWTEAIK